MRHTGGLRFRGDGVVLEVAQQLTRGGGHVLFLDKTQRNDCDSLALLSEAQVLRLPIKHISSTYQ